VFYPTCAQGKNLFGSVRKYRTFLGSEISYGTEKGSSPGHRLGKTPIFFRVHAESAGDAQEKQARSYELKFR
jgi:hypothetical protein